MPLPDHIEHVILEHAATDWPNEAVGLVTRGPDGYRYWPAENADPSPDAFLIAPRQQFDLLHEIDREGHRLVGISHSHPRGTPQPSERDLTFARRWPGVAILIAASGIVRAFTPEGVPA